MSDSEQVEGFDHAKRADDLLAEVGDPNAPTWCPDARDRPRLEVAQVHATIAVAHELREQNHWLEEIANQLSRAQS